MSEKRISEKVEGRASQGKDEEKKHEKHEVGKAWNQISNK